MRILQNHPERRAQRVLFDLADRNPVIGDRAVRDVIEAVDEVRDRRLPRAGGTDKRDLLPRMRIQRHIRKHLFFAVVTEVNVLEVDLAAHRNQFVFTLPCPMPGTA